MEALVATKLSELAEKENLLPVTVLAQLHIWHKSRTLPGSSICTVACLLRRIPCL